MRGLWAQNRAILYPCLRADCRKSLCTNYPRLGSNQQPSASEADTLSN